MWALKNSNPNKSPGPDGLNYEFYKNLPIKWIYYIENLFNKVLSDEVVPLAWSEMHASMLHKKGDKNEPANFRLISLINCISKLFTQVLNERLAKWSNECDALP